MFGKHTWKYSWIPFAGKALWTRVVQCSFNCVHFHCCKIARWNMNSIQSTIVCQHQEDSTSDTVAQLVVWSVGGPGVPRSKWRYTETISNPTASFLKKNRTCVLKLRQFSKRVTLQKNISTSLPYVRIRDFCMVSLAPSHLSYGGSSLTSSLLKSLWVIYDVFSTLDGSSAPVTCSCVCTNKTCFAGVGTWPKAIFWIGMISFVSCPCESKKNQNFLSTDQTSIPGVNQVFPVLEWNLIFVLLSKILDRLKRLFVVQIPQVTVHREMRIIYV